MDRRTLGYFLMIAGFLLMTVGLVLSEGYVKQLGFLGSLPRMHVELSVDRLFLAGGTQSERFEALRQRRQDRKKEGPKIKLKVVLVIGLLFLGSGLAQVLLSRRRPG